MFAAAPAAAGGIVPGAWLEAAKNPQQLEEFRREIALRKAEGGYQDYTPLASELAAASRTAPNPDASRTLAYLAAEAAPGDVLIQWTAMRAALSGSGHFGEAVRAGWASLSACFTDPWAKFGLSSRLTLIGCLAAGLIGVAILAAGVPCYIKPFEHDFRDRFPRDVQRIAPVAAAVLGVVCLLSLGVGALMIVLVPAFLLAPYMLRRAQIALFVALAVSLGVFTSLDMIGRMGGVSGDRAWVVYRIYKGDAGRDLDAKLLSVFPEGGPKISYLRGLLARREGRLDDEKGFLKEALDAGADKSLIQSETGSLRFLQGDLVGSVEAYAKAAELNPSDWLSWYNLSVVQTARLDMVGAEQSMSKAKAIDAKAIDRHQAASAVLGGRIYPTFRNFPAAWVSDELNGNPATRSEWPAQLWALFGVSHRAVQPFYLIPVLLLGLAYAHLADKTSLSRRCSSCGSVKCPRCHRLVKEADVCGTCWSLSHEAAKIDLATRHKLRANITHWTHQTRKARRIGAVILPGWSDFVFGGGIGGVFIGLVWAVSLAGLVAAWLVPFPPLPRGSLGGVSLGFFAVLALCYITSFLSSRRH